MIEKIKFFIRKNKFILAALKPIYKCAHSIKTLPSRKKAHKALIARLKGLEVGIDRVWYFCIPTHPNLGDQAQRCCIDGWLNENYPEKQVFHIASNGWNYHSKQSMAQLKKLALPTDIIVMQSGYTFAGVNYHPDEIIHKTISEEFKDNKILFFPQTILYRREKDKIQMSKAINSHQKTLLLARDRVSYESAKEYYPDIKVDLFPDIVTSQIGKYSFNNERNGVLFCIRNDAERFYSDGEIKKMMDDVSEFISVKKTDTTVSSGEIILERDALWEKVLKTVEEYSRYKLIITDRYHGTIFSLIAGTPVLVLKTNDHKVITGAEWFKGVYDSHVYREDDYSVVGAKAKEILSVERENQLPPYFDENYYKKLKEQFEKI